MAHTQGWVGTRSEKRTLKLRLDAKSLAELDALAAANRTTRSGAFKLLQAFSRHGFNQGLVREINGRCNAIHLRVANLKLRAVAGSESFRQLSEVDTAARDISAMMIPEADS